MKSIEEIRDWLLANAVNNEGDLYLVGLDLSNFDGDVFISKMKVKNNLYQNFQIVGKSLMQNYQKSGEDLLQYCQDVGKSLYQDSQKVGEEFYNHKLNKNEYWEEYKDYVMRRKNHKKITKKQLAEMGYELEEEK